MLQLNSWSIRKLEMSRQPWYNDPWNQWLHRCFHLPYPCRRWLRPWSLPDDHLRVSRPIYTYKKPKKLNYIKISVLQHYAKYKCPPLWVSGVIVTSVLLKDMLFVCFACTSIGQNRCFSQSLDVRWRGRAPWALRLLPSVHFDMFFSNPKTVLLNCAGVRSTFEQQRWRELYKLSNELIK